jgi:hypothetical protein
MLKVKVGEENYIPESVCKRTKLPKGDASNPFFRLGHTYFIRTVTNYFTGRLIWVGDKEIALEDVCWIADTGRFNEFMSKDTWGESEPYPAGVPVVIGRGSIIDMVERTLILTVK